MVDEMGALSLLKFVFWWSIIAALTLESASSAKVTVSACNPTLYTSQEHGGRLFIQSSI